MQRWQVLLAMRLEQLRELSTELDLVRPPTGIDGDDEGRHRVRERLINLQESDRLLLQQGIRDTAVALAHAAAPVESARHDPATASRMRLIAKKVVAGAQRRCAPQQRHLGPRRRGWRSRR